VVGVAAFAALAPGDSTESSATDVSSAQISAPGGDALRVYLDPETGELTSGTTDPNAVIELEPELQNALRYDDEGLQYKSHANGSVSVDLEGRYQSASVVHKDENGQFTFCTDNPADVERAMNTPVSNPAVPEVK
jgi:hypothetical protein